MLGDHGEFGNQLFQIAATIGTAHKLGTDYDFPVWRCRKSNVEYSKFFKNKIPETLRARLSEPFYIYNEPSFKFKEITDIPKNTNIDLIGYFQSDLYFADFREEILSKFEPSDSVLNKIKNSSIDYNNSVALQLRFYDSVRAHNMQLSHADPTNGDNFYFTVEENLDYLNKAVEFFGRNKIYYVSSNNYNKAKNLNLNIPNLIFLEDFDHVERFFIHSLCENNIITNSTFGWWSAWLNKNPDKIVFAPKKWFRSSYIKEEDAATIYPRSWKIL